MKKIVKIVCIILGIIILLGIIFFAIDCYRVNKQETPIFCIKNAARISDGGTVEYLGLGYKVIDFHTLSGFDDIKIGTWFMDYDDFLNEFEENNRIATIKAVVVKVNENSLFAMGTENATSLYSVGFTDEGNIGFEQGQEIEIYFDGTILSTYPEQLSNVEKIEITKEKSDTEIPQNILRYCYSSKENVTVSIKELTNHSISLSIEDTNELPYTYTNDYIIYQKIKNENYTGVGEIIGEQTENSTAGFTRNRN